MKNKTIPETPDILTKTYTIIGGVNGAGKSSLTGVLRNERREELGTVIDPDALARERGISPEAAGRLVVKLIDDCLRDEKSFTQETTLSGKKTLRTIRRARTLGYKIQLFYVGIDSAEEHLLRIANRVRKGGHNIPPDAVTRRFAARLQSLADVLPLCDEAVFFENENGFRPVGAFSDGELFLACPPAWLTELEHLINNNQTR